MQCMKCGRDVEAEQVFCETCCADMGKYPVKPGTVVLLPHYHPVSNIPKRVPKKAPLPDEQIRRLKKRGRVLGWILALFVVLTAVLAWACGSLYVKYDGKYLPGQNYSVVGSKNETTAPETETAPKSDWDGMFHVKQG